MVIRELIAGFFVCTGFFFFFTATVGLLRLPDFYSRLHATGKGDTLAVLFSLIGLAVYEGFSLTSVKIVLIAVFMFLAQPTATHAISRAAFRCNVKPLTTPGGPNR
ncbi:MAG: monovalent cation/H(+) antiporter subunit G [Deltaproteobacteria bacterium]|nr:monovalent cation/H(+) antiporter subunit G [Deltaproteobacteria bacterium]MBW2049049.1 monovalent cation/H(+) antiporter subunit G [Deltaproteobacteria bacterium]MBW2111009.1 monovalent cation/H(+) antiporter subunit G [Deltaproteobacteria bacterium]MBW2353180.1 monovalent cation/H(+) antiporter subunit G [Deltaproteobacteria bacterium]HDZ89238.1 cation:proton antiporter [Deltaproteobacteria bacterium]